MEIHLGFAPGIGRMALDQCQDFKEGMWRRIGRNIDGAFLKTVHKEERAGIVVDYDIGIETAQAWALEAEQVAETVWTEIRNMRAIGLRIVARRSM